MSQSTKIIIENTGRGRYRVCHAGKVLIEETRQPETDACRALLTIGITGRLETWRSDRPYPCMRLDIEAGAKLTVEERDNCRPRFRRWAPHPDTAEQYMPPALRGPAKAAIFVQEASVSPPTFDPANFPTTRPPSPAQASGGLSR